METRVVLRQGYWLVEKVALLVAMLATVATVAVYGFFLVSEAVNATAGTALIRVPSLTQFDISSLGPRVVAGSYGDVTLSIVDAPGAARTLLVIAAVVTLAAIFTAGVAVFLLCLSLFRSRPFGRSVTGIWFLVAVVMIGDGIAGPILRGEASRLIVSSLSLGTTSSPVGLGDAALYIAREVNALPLVIGFTLLVVASAFAVGSRLRRETQGLI